MSTSTNAYISFGIELEEGHEFPWDDSNEDDWWVDVVHGYQPPFRMYTDEGNYLPEHLDSRGNFDPKFDHIRDKYYAHKRAFKDALPPLPVKLVNTCSADYPEYIIAVPGTVSSAWRGSPQQLNTDVVFYVDQEKLKAYTDFIKKYMPELEDEPSWYLSSYWG